MLTSLAFIFLAGLLMAAVCKRLKLPGIIGMLITGIVLGPYVLDLLDPSILSVSSDLRQMALIIILLKAGLSLDLSDLKRVGLMDEKYGTEKSIPQLILAGASCDDIFVIVLFSTFSGMAQGGHANVMDFVNIPVSIVLGIALGAAAGFVLSVFFETSYAHKHCVRNSVKVIIVLGVSFLLMAVETWLKGMVPVSGLLAVVSMACVIRIRCVPQVTARLSEKFGKLWLAAEVILFVLVGAAVDIRYTLEAGIAAVAMIFAALIFRGIGVSLCLIKTPLSFKERLFCIIAYLPKATVQAAIGSVPLAMGLPCGKIVLSVAVLAIFITAPLGAIGIDSAYKKLLTHDENG